MRTALLLCVLAATAAAKHHRHRVPQIDLHGADALTVQVREDERTLATVPELAIVSESGPVCEYEISGKDGKPVPFEAEVIDRFSGAAIIRVKDAVTLDCKSPAYELSIVAVKCDDESIRSEPVSLKITVKDTNNHAPEFEEPWYTFQVDEGKVVPEIARLSASDADCGHPYGEICEYEITNGLDNFPFAIDKQGVLRNTQPLNYTQTKSYILTIVAHDCGMRKSKSALVTVTVRESCVPGVRDAPERLSYQAAQGPKVLLPQASVNTCEDATCSVESVSAVVELRAGHVTEGCSRESLFSNQTRKSCGINPATMNLLPEEIDDDSDSASSEENEVAESSEKSDRFTFDGTTKAVVVNRENVKGLIPDKFALSFSMKHAKGNKEQQNNKQNILCESDDFNMNRHHFSVYIRHCKLEVVLRREAGASSEFRAAEWRWATPEVCDDTWHSYSLLFNGVDDVHLMIDGKAFKADERNPEILDDWPLHKTKQTKTRLVVGACWHGRQQQLSQFFSGKLASMHLLTGATESQEAIQCAHRCPEQLQYSGIDELRDGQSAVVNNEMNTVTLKAANGKDLSKMIQKIAYVNTQESPAPGHRQLTVSGTVNCKEGKTIDLPPHRGYVFVQKSAPPTISISGAAVLSADQHAIKVGTPMLPDIQITISQTAANGEVSEVTGQHSLDYCKVHLKPSRDLDVEYFSSPASLVASMNIDFEHDKQGILLRGAERVKAYREVLSRIHYFNTRPDSYAKRIYSVQCAMDKGRVLSNEFVVTMIIEPSPSSSAVLPTDVPESLEILERHLEPAFDQLGSSRLQNILEMDLPRPKALLSHHGYDAGQGAIAGGAVAVVVVVCVGFLLILLVIGVLKMRDTPLPRKRRSRKPEGGMEWDDSGMNITVNPLDDVEKGEGEEEEDECDIYSDEDSDEESECSFRDEDMSEEEEGEEVLPHVAGQPLEWDDSPVAGALSRSYRV